MRLITIIFSLLLVLPVAASAQAQPIIAFDSDRELYKCLDRITSIQQLYAANDARIVKGGYCSFGRPVVPFSANWHGFHQSDDFIFPIFRLDFDTDGLRRYSNDGIFKRSDWEVVHNPGLNVCLRNQIATFDGCLVPKRCDALSGFDQMVGTKRKPGYIRVPPRCARWRG